MQIHKAIATLPLQRKHFSVEVTPLTNNLPVLSHENLELGKCIYQ